MTLNTVLRNIVIGGLFLIPVILPFIVANSMFFPFITGKNFFFRILVGLLFGIWVLLALRDARYRPTFSWLLVAIVAFVAVIGIADLLGENPFKSIWSNFERMEGWVTLLHLLLYFLVASSVLTTAKLWGWFAHLSVGASMLVAVYGLFQLGGVFQINQGGVRLDATFGNATYLAIYMVFHIFITALLMHRSRLEGWARYLYLLPMALQAVILYHTATRGAILGCMGGALLTALLLSVCLRGRSTLRYFAIGAVALVLAFAGAFIAIKDAAFVNESPVLSRFSTLSPAEFTEETRFVIWSMAWEGIKERPWLGWGQENFNLVFNEQYHPELYDDEPWFDRVHNIILDWLIAGGAVGLAAYLAIPILCMWYLWHPRNRVHFSVPEKSLWTGLGAAYFFHNLFVFDNIASYILFFSILAYVHALIGKPASGERAWGRGVSPETMRVAMPFVLIIVVFGVYFFNGKGVATSRALIDGLSAPTAEARMTSFEQALAYDALGRQEVAEQMMQFALRAREQRESLEAQQRIFARAEEALSQEIERAPRDARTRLFLSALYGGYAFPERAREQIDQAAMLSPRKQIILHQAAFNRVQLGDTDEARRLFQKAFELNTNYTDARILYAVGNLYTGDFDRAEELLAGVSNPDELVTNTALLNAYANLGLFEKIAALWEGRVERNPEDFQARLTLSGAYLQLERRDEAVAQLQEAIRVDPNFAEQGALLINEIRAGRNPVDSSRF